MSHKMIEAYPTMPRGDGPFTDLQELDVPWKSLDIADVLDGYYFGHSGNKLLSPIISFYCTDYATNAFDALSAENRATLAAMIYAMYSAKWEHLYNLLTLQYNPVTNYDMTEAESITRETTASGTDTGTVKNTGTDTLERTGTIDTDTSGSVEDSIFGFNSSAGVDSNASENASSSTVTNDTTDEQTKNLTETRDLANSAESEYSESRELTRSGNIGVTTTQQMIRSEIELWQWQFFEGVCKDIDAVLCLSVY